MKKKLTTKKSKQHNIKWQLPHLRMDGSVIMPLWIDDGEHELMLIGPLDSVEDRYQLRDDMEEVLQMWIDAAEEAADEEMSPVAEIRQKLETGEIGF
jgi:hypothetical protein